MPHAWKAGKQTELLKARLDAVPDGGLIVMIAPPNPYRCPPGPYERVSMMAHVLKAAGKTKREDRHRRPEGGLLQAATCSRQGWTKHYPGMVEWLGPKIHEGVKSVDPKTNTVVTGFETYKAALVNVIPGADGRQDRARCRFGQPERVLPDRSDQHEVDEPIPTSTSSAMPAFPATCRSRRSLPTARPRSRP